MDEQVEQSRTTTIDYYKAQSDEYKELRKRLFPIMPQHYKDSYYPDDVMRFIKDIQKDKEESEKENTWLRTNIGGIIGKARDAVDAINGAINKALLEKQKMEYSKTEPEPKD